MSLQGVTFVRKELRFQFVDTGEDLVFRGNLDGDTSPEVRRSMESRVYSPM